MTTTFLIASASFIVFCCVLGYIRSKSIAHQLAIKVKTLETELKNVQVIEQNLREENSTLQNKLRHTFEDTVTNLLGWQLFEDRLHHSIHESERYQLTLGILFVDIDDFRVINDALNYESGDAVLQEVASRLKTCIRQVDSIARFTKDTFVILLPQLAKPETAAIVAQRILQSLVEPIKVKDQDLYVTACIGIAVYPADGQDAATILRSADHALHLAKEKGKQNYQFYQEKMHVKSLRELSVYNNLNRESVLEEFVLYYQPIVNVISESIICMDVLAHWQHPSLGLIESQELFVYAAKQHKLNVLSEWLLQNACRQFKRWHSLGFTPEFLGIPLAISQLENSHFIYRISQILQELDMKPASILLEIKETDSAINFSALEKTFNMLKFVGVKIAINDFGTGSFSIASLKNFEINYLKLDKSLITDINTNTQAVALVKSLVYLSKTMSMQIIVQGVESDKQMTVLKNLECILMQGHLLGRPLSEQEVTKKYQVLIS